MNKKVIISGIVILVLVLVGAWFFISRGDKEETGESTTIEETFITEAPIEEVEEPEFEKGDYSIKVLNGSGKTGIAAALQEDLVAAGYTMGEDPGNADDDNYENTIIQAKSSVPEGFIDLLKEELSSKYDTIETEELDESENVDVVIIIGGQQEEETEETEEEAAPTTAEEESEATSEGDVE